VVAESEFHFRQLGLDETSSKRYPELTKTDYQNLKTIVDSSLDRFGTNLHG